MFADIIQELMETYTAKREEWIKRFGDDIGFDLWFTGQTHFGNFDNIKTK
jgi:hypothetical protein